MRKVITAAVAATIMSLGLQSAKALSVSAAQQAAATYTGANASASTDNTPGAELAGLVHAAQSGSTGLSSSITTLADGIVSFEGGDYFGDEAYGLAVAGHYGYAPISGPSYTSDVQAFYASKAGSDSGATYAASLVDPTLHTTVPATNKIYYLAYNVLGSNVAGGIGGGASGAYATTLLSTLGKLQVSGGTSSDGTTGTGSDNLTNDGANRYVDTVQALALSLYALKSVGVSESASLGSGGGTYSGQQVSDLYTTLNTLLLDTPNSAFFQSTNHTGQTPATSGGSFADLKEGYTEDLAYGILALSVESSPNTALITSLENELATAVDPSGTTTVNVVYSGGGASLQYAGALLQALPEPASLSLVGLGAMALMGRRRRQA